MAKIEILKKKHKGEWLAIEVTKKEGGRPSEGRLILHKKDREELWKKAKVSKQREIFVTFAGPMVEKGYAVAF